MTLDPKIQQLRQLKEKSKMGRKCRRLLIVMDGCTPLFKNNPLEGISVSSESNVMLLEKSSAIPNTIVIFIYILLIVPFMSVPLNNNSSTISSYLLPFLLF